MIIETKQREDGFFVVEVDGLEWTGRVGRTEKEALKPLLWEIGELCTPSRLARVCSPTLNQLGEQRCVDCGTSVPLVERNHPDVFTPCPKCGTRRWEFIVYKPEAFAGRLKRKD